MADTLTVYEKCEHGRLEEHVVQTETTTITKEEALQRLEQLPCSGGREIRLTALHMRNAEGVMGMARYSGPASRWVDTCIPDEQDADYLTAYVEVTDG